MEFINENLKTPINGEYDVIVVGGGPAGACAAICAARSGMRTVLIERFNCLGGGWTTGFINPFFDYEDKCGIVNELVSDLRASGNWGGFWNKSFNYEYMKYILETKAKDAGVELLYNTVFSRTICDKNTVKGVIADNINGRFALMSRVVIDATGDGAVAASAGCPFEIGEDGDPHACQAMTLMFLVGNIPEKYRDGLRLYEKLNAVYEKGGKVLPFKVPFLIPIPGTHFGVIQFTHMYDYNPLENSDITAATIEGRRQIIESFELLTKHDPEFAELELITSANVLGVRESRRIICEYTLTLEDILEGRKFDDAVARVTFGADLHTKSNKGQKCFAVKPYQIPLRALIPKGYEGLLVAGRCISGDRNALASYRVTGNCAQMGENLGYAIAEAIKSNINIRDVKCKFTLTL